MRSWLKHSHAPAAVPRTHTLSMNVCWPKGLRSPGVSVLSQEVMRVMSMSAPHWPPPEFHCGVLCHHTNAVPHWREESTGTGTNSHRQQKEGRLLWGWARGEENCYFSSINTKREDEFSYCVSSQDLLIPWLHPGEIQHQQHELNQLLFRTVPGCVGLLQVQVTLHSVVELPDNSPLWKGGRSSFCFPHWHPQLQKCLPHSAPALELAGSPPEQIPPANLAEN